MTLTPKQQAFVDYFLEEGNASEAYRRAYPTAQKWSDNAVGVEAHRLLKNPKVSLTIQERRQKVSHKYDITFETVLTGLLREATREGDGGPHGARVKAWESIARLLGFEPPKDAPQEAQHLHQHLHLESVSTEDLRRLLHGDDNPNPHA